MNVDEFFAEENISMYDTFHTVICKDCGEFVADFLFRNEAEEHLHENGNICPKCKKSSLIIEEGY